MGKKARELAGPNVDKLIDLLNKAFCDEWAAFYYYGLAAKLAEGLNSPPLAGTLEKIGKEELEHANELADRIIELGGQPVREFADLPKIANYPKVNLPVDFGDLRGILQAVIEAERGAIDVYNSILQDLQNICKDPVTFHVIRHIMGEEIAHEDEFETILGSCPE
ncbi:MAG TPA: ferritin-like domain-containing protein [Atribacteraceae bacterium]|nr:ferritin-like domain-containing protein [Atribacteraceae bacterium]